MQQGQGAINRRRGLCCQRPSATADDAERGANVELREHQAQKPGWITEDERHLAEKSVPDGVCYEKWLLCRPENSEKADMHMFVFSEESCKACAKYLPKFDDETDSASGNVHEKIPHTRGLRRELEDCLQIINQSDRVKVDLNQVDGPSGGVGHQQNNGNMCMLWEKLDAVIDKLEDGAEGEATFPLRDGQNLLHVAVIFGWTGMVGRILQCCSKASDTPSCTDNKIFDKIFSKDSKGFTPLHYMAWYGRFEILQVLFQNARELELAKWLPETSCGKRNVFHLSARNGHARTLKLLIYIAASFKLNLVKLLTSKDNFRLTPLHLSALHGYTHVTHLLLKNGAFADAEDCYERTPLHLAAIRGHTKVGESIVEHSGMRIVNKEAKDGHTALIYACGRDKGDFLSMLLSHNAAVKAQDDQEPSALHFAVRLRCRRAVRAILMSDRWQEAFAALGETRAGQNVKTNGRKQSLSIRGSVAKNVTNVLAEEPELFEILLERFASEDESYSEEKLLEATNLLPDEPLQRHYLFHCLYHQFDGKDNISCAASSRSHNSTSSSRSRLLSRNCSIHADCGEAPLHETTWDPEESACLVQTILNHPNLRHLLLKPIIVQWMRKKWIHFTRKLVIFNLCVYLVFLVSFMVSIATVEPYQRCDTCDPNKFKRGHAANVASIFVVLISLCSLIKECVEWWNKGRSYFLDLANYIEWPLYVLSIIFAIGGSGTPSKNMWIIGMLATTLCWANFLLFIRRFTFFGIYVVMFFKIFDTVLQVLVVYALFILGFGFAFYILLSEMENFDSIAKALATTLRMATDEMDLTQFYSIPAIRTTGDGANKTCAGSEQRMSLLYPVWSWIYLIVFVFVGPIILTNMLTGLAVDDIAEIRKKSSEEIAERQAMLILQSERSVYFCQKKTKRFSRFFPNFFDKAIVHQKIVHRGAAASSEDISVKERFVKFARSCAKVFAFNLDDDKGFASQLSEHEWQIDNDSLEVTNKQIAKMMMHMNSRLDHLSRGHDHLTRTISDLGLQQMDSTTVHVQANTMQVDREQQQTKDNLRTIKNRLDQLMGLFNQLRKDIHRSSQPAAVNISDGKLPSLSSAANCSLAEGEKRSQLHTVARLSPEDDDDFPIEIHEGGSKGLLLDISKRESDV